MSAIYVLPACPKHGMTVEEASDYDRQPNCSVCEDAMSDEIERLRSEAKAWQEKADALTTEVKWLREKQNAPCQHCHWTPT